MNFLLDTCTILWLQCLPAAGDGNGFPAADAFRRLGVVLDAGQVRRYLTCMKTTVSSKGQIVLPAEFRRLDRIEPGQEFNV